MVLWVLPHVVLRPRLIDPWFGHPSVTAVLLHEPAPIADQAPHFWVEVVLPGFSVLHTRGRSHVVSCRRTGALERGTAPLGVRSLKPHKAGDQGTRTGLRGEGPTGDMWPTRETILPTQHHHNPGNRCKQRVVVQKPWSGHIKVVHVTSVTPSRVYVSSTGIFGEAFRCPGTRKRERDEEERESIPLRSLPRRYLPPPHCPDSR